jgi:FKBP-type peptidyl-prolyl cis-trans isomerase
MIKQSVARAGMRIVHQRHQCVAKLNSENVTHVSPRQNFTLARRESLAILIGSILATPFVPASDAAPSKAASDWASADDDGAPKFFKTPNGVPYQVLSEGTGKEAHRGNKVLVDFVLRRSNGYFIYGTVEGVSFQPNDVPTGAITLQLDNSSTVAGLVEAMEGMKEGGKRRILVPPQYGYVNGSIQEPKMPTFATQRQLQNHSSEPLLFELQLLRIIS